MTPSQAAITKAKELLSKCTHENADARGYACTGCIATALDEAADMSQKPEKSDTSGGYVAEKDEAQAAAQWAYDHSGPLIEAREIVRDAYLAGLAKGREMERQRCAEIADAVANNGGESASVTSYNIAAAIRGSGK